MDFQRRQHDGKQAAGTPVYVIVGISLCMGFFNSLQFSSMNTIAYADVDKTDSSMASTIASSMQQLSMSFGLAFGSLITGWYLGDMPQSNRAMLSTALHHAFLTLAALTILSSLTFWTLRRDDGESISKGSDVDEDDLAEVKAKAVVQTEVRTTTQTSKD